MRRTKIVATLGPATHTPECIRQLIEAGMNVARMNFSHGTHADHAARIAGVRAAAAEAGTPVALLQDLQGPKIRTGALAGGGPVELIAGRTLTITTEEVPGDAARISTTYAALPHDVRPGDRVLLSDGLIELRVRQTTDREVVSEVVHGGLLGEHQGINLPGVQVSAPAVTDKDLDDLRFGLAQGVDYVAISFVRRADDVQRVKDEIARAGQDAPVIAKLERPEAIDALEDILRVADGVMVARGDLGVELPPEDVPLIQKQIIEAANRRALPVITATQMLESMIHNPRPTRAEVSDVANAILDGSDAVMLSGETATGSFPIEAVQMMAHIAETVEASGRCFHRLTHLEAWLSGQAHSIPEAIGAAVSAIVKALPVRAILVLTQTGDTARLVSQHRPEVPILAFTPYDHVCRRLSLLWGVHTIQMEFYDHLREFTYHVQPLLIELGYAQPGDMIVITGGHPLDRHGPTNLLKVLRVEAP